MRLYSLKDLLIASLRDIYDAEIRITKALPKMAKAASSEQLSAAFEEHLTETLEQVRRLERAFEEVGETPRRKRCEVIVGIIEEGKEILEESADEAVADAGSIAAAQKVEHYEMAAYVSARTWARTLGLETVAQLMQETLDEEIETDRKLTAIAETLNAEAVKEEELGEEKGADARGRRAPPSRNATRRR